MHRVTPWASLHAADALHPPPITPGRPPCDGCYSACCWVVQLSQTVPETLVQLDFLKFVAGFERIELGINPEGRWVVNYRAPCRHLDADLRCELHGTPQKPLVCQRYDEHRCMYRSAFLGGHKDTYLRIDLRRFRALEALLTFDEAGRVAHTPSREEMLAAFLAADLEPERIFPPPPEDAPRKTLLAGVAWNEAAARPTGVLPAAAEVPLSYAEANASPCSRCPAPCCQVLVFDFGAPAHVSSVDFMEYLLGFPGLELALTESGWKTLVRSTCKHLDRATNLCAAFGSPERPLICQRYDAHKCAYRGWLMEPQRIPFVRVEHDVFQRVRAHFPIDPDGNVRAQLTVDQLLAILDVVAPDRARVAPLQAMLPPGGTP